MSTIAPGAAAPGTAAIEPDVADTKVAVATQLQLTWWRFRKHKVALWSGVIILLFLFFVG